MIIRTAITPPTYRGALKNAIDARGPPPAHMTKPEVHHGLPWNHKDWFASKGIDVNDVQFGAWVEGAGSNNHHN